MKRIIFILSLVLLMTSCGEKGTTVQRLNGSEQSLPPELKGLKVYSVCIENGSYIKVAVLNGQTIGTEYQHGKHNECVVIVNNKTSETRTIYATEIISETDSIIVLRK